MGANASREGRQTASPVASPVVAASAKDQAASTLAYGTHTEAEKQKVVGLVQEHLDIQIVEIPFDKLHLETKMGVNDLGDVIQGTYLGEKVVVKRMFRANITERDHLQQFFTWTMRRKALKHPNIVQFKGASWNSYSNLCFVTEWLDRGTLSSVLHDDTNELSWSEPLLQIAIDIAEGMNYLHTLETPIIHRNLKSDCVHVASSWRAKVGDFELCRELAQDQAMTHTGTPFWMAPEMIRAVDYTFSVDVYSFGILLSELDTRKVPYHDAATKQGRKVAGTALLQMIAFDDLRPSLSDTCPAILKDLFQRCTSSDDASRPSFKQIVEVLNGSVREELKAGELSGKDPSPVAA